MAKQINFTKEHEQQLCGLMLGQLFSGDTIKGAMGTELNAHQLLHETSLKTLQQLYVNTSKDIENKSKLDRWSMTDYQQGELDRLKQQAELLDLLIGYKKSEAVNAANAEILKEKRNMLKQLKDESKTPKERIEELEKEISEIES